MQKRLVTVKVHDGCYFVVCLHKLSYICVLNVCLRHMYTVQHHPPADRYRPQSLTRRPTSAQLDLARLSQLCRQATTETDTLSSVRK